MGIPNFVTRDLRMSAIGSKSNGPDQVDLYMGLLRRVGGERISLLSPYGGTKECNRRCTLARSALPFLFKKMSYRRISEFLDLTYSEAVALDLLSLVHFSDKRAPLLGIFLEAISHFLRYAAASMAKEGNRYVRVIVVLTAPGTTGWHVLDEPPAPVHMASLKALAQVATMRAVDGSGTCTICCEEYDGGVRTPCGHEFHRGCMALWLDTTPSCPLCRNALGGMHTHTFSPRNHHERIPEFDGNSIR